VTADEDSEKEQYQPSERKTHSEGRENEREKSHFIIRYIQKFPLPNPSFLVKMHQ